MIKDKEKLEELMYISLIGKFDFIHKTDFKSFIAFTSTNYKEDEDIIKPIYVTGEDAVSNKIALLKVKSFENKAFKGNKFLKALNQNKIMSGEGQEKISFIKRIKDYINEVYNTQNAKGQAKIRANFESNIKNLEKNNVINDVHAEVAISYLSSLFCKEDINRF